MKFSRNIRPISAFANLFIFAVALSEAPFVRADGETAGSNSFSGTVSAKQSTLQNINILSDYSGALFLDGKKIGALKANRWDPFKTYKIQVAAPAVYHLELRKSPDVIRCDVSVELGHDANVNWKIGEPVVGQSELEINFHPPKRTWWYVAAGASVLLVAGLVAVVLNSLSHSSQDWWV